MFSYQGTRKYTVSVGGWVNTRSLFFDQINGCCFLQITTRDREHYNKCEECLKRVKFIAQIMSSHSEFELIEASFIKTKGDDGIYAKFKPGFADAPIPFLGKLLKMEVVCVGRNDGSVENPSCYGHAYSLDLSIL